MIVRGLQKHKPLLFLLSFALALSACSCDESLPPRDDPPNFLQPTFSPLSGRVVFPEGDTVAVGLVGNFLISIKNTYVEVLQGQEDIQVDIDMWLVNQPDKRGHIHGNRNNVLNYELLDSASLTLPPDSSVRILIGGDHRTLDGTRFWNYGNMRLHSEPQQDYFLSDSMLFEATAKVRLFKYVDSLPTLRARFMLAYFIRVRFPSAVVHTEIENMQGTVGNGNVLVQWETAQEVKSYGFVVQKSLFGDPQYSPIGFVRGNGTTYRRNYYSYVDTTVSRGTWWYSLQEILDFGVIQWPYQITAPLVVVVP